MDFQKAIKSLDHSKENGINMEREVASVFLVEIAIKLGFKTIPSESELFTNPYFLLGVSGCLAMGGATYLNDNEQDMIGELVDEYLKLEAK